MIVLIPAVNGRVASAAARRLIVAGVQVRALARDRNRAVAALAPGTDAGIDDPLVDLRIGELDDPAFLGRALRGVDAAFLSVGTDPRQVELKHGFKSP